MNRNALYLVIGVLAVVSVGVSYHFYQEQNKPGLQISIGDSAISVKTK